MRKTGVDLWRAVSAGISLSSTKEVKKVWGTEWWIVNTPQYCFKILEINPGMQCSLHYHPLKDETFTIIEGDVKLEIGYGTEYMLVGPGHQEHILAGRPHRFGSKVGALIFESSTFHSDDDVVRVEPSGPIP